jgi:subtilisin family serine protease
MKRCVLFFVVLSICFVQHAQAANNFIVRVDNGPGGIQLMCQTISCTVTSGLDGSLGQVFLVNFPDTLDPKAILEMLDKEKNVLNAERDILEIIPPLPLGGIPAGLGDPRMVSFFGSLVWNSYANQPAAQVINAGARTKFNVSGSGIVAVIDTGIDPNHPALKNVVVGGYDFTRNTEGTPSELADLTQPVSPKIDGVPPAYVNQSTAAVVDQNTATLISPYGAFGHGTMVSGVIHAVAPTAMILPLKAFTANGTGALSDIIRAIYYGVQYGASVLNMSFSTSDNSKELQKAVSYAVTRGVIAVAAAGNDGKAMLVYPAALSNVIGVASTDYQDQRSWFSNFGQPPVFVAAPGESIISTFPFGTYGASSGTSFSAPLVTGAVTLLKNLRGKIDSGQVAQAISRARWLGPALGYGRLDVYQALSYLSSLR